MIIKVNHRVKDTDIVCEQKWQAMPVLIHSAHRGKNPDVISPSALLVEGSAPKPLWTQNFILRLRVRWTLMTMTGLPLAVVFFLFFFLFLIHFQQPIHIGLCRQKFPHFLTGTPVLGVGFLLFLQQLGILGLQVFDLGQLLYTYLVKGIFGCLMEPPRII